ncbi:MAG: class I SAM-dependent methyltransferase [Pirellulales bacterium]
MDSTEEAAAYDAMDHRGVNERFVDDLLAVLPELGPFDDQADSSPDPPERTADGPWPPRIIDLGTGTAQIPVILCNRNRELRMVATDLSESMLQLARLNIELGGCGHQIRLDKADVKQLPYATAMWDVVLSNSLVHHLADPAVTVAEIWRITRPGGTIFVRDLCRPADASQLEQLVATYVDGEPEPAREMFRASLHAALTLAEIQAIVSEAGGDRTAVTMTSDRHWTWQQRRSAVPH